jgi:MFS family permease
MTESPQRWRQLVLLATVQLLGMSVWFAATAVAPALRERLLLSPGQSAWLTSAVQLGFVAGTLIAALLNFADILPMRWYVAGAAILAALANLALIPAASFGQAFAGRALTGMALAGVYPPAMKMAATWFRAGRGLAIGSVVGALNIGKAIPYLLEGSAQLPVAAVVWTTSCAAAVGGIAVALFYRDGPHAFPARPFSWSLARDIVREPELRRITGGYLGHMWELYAFWAWMPAFLTAAFSAHQPGATAGIWPFVCVAIGAVGAVGGGLAADRTGRLPVVRVALIVSGACCIASALAFRAPEAVLIGICVVWGIAAVADSAQFSALMTEQAPPHAVGTALTLQTSLGFLLTIVTIQLVPMVARATGWQWAMVILALGPVAGLWSVRERGERRDERR